MDAPPKSMRIILLRRPFARGRMLVCTAALIALAGCVKPAPEAEPATGTVTVGVLTKGPDIGGLTFNVAIEPSAAGGPIKADAGLFTAPRVPSGDVVVRLTGLPARCRIDGAAERQIHVSPRRTTAVKFSVLCQ